VKKENALIILFSIILIVLVIVLSFTFFAFFNSKNPSLISQLDVTFESTGERYDYNDINGFENSSVYSFVINNNNSISSKYDVLLKDQKSTIDRKFINFKLYRNNKVIKQGKLSDIRENIIDRTILNPNNHNDYRFVIWIDDKKDIDSDSYYTYYLKVVPVLNQ
jgi:hypothetical protein